MALSRKRNRFREWLSGLFSLKDEIRVMPNGPQYPSERGGFMTHAQGFALHNPTMTAVHGNQYNTTYVQGDRNIVPQIMDLLSQHVIRGAAHDSSARTPPPRCHPGTRVNLLARITAWFKGQEIQELLLWITGPAGVGKSALVQTFAEYLVKSKSLGASVFISRPNKRNKPHGIFITIAYQLATRIEAYRNFIIERLCLDPELLRGNIQAQFATFIVEPFVERKIGAGGKRWCILLDGLDELQGEDAQRNIIRLISNFVLEHRDTPLVWIIASRPELHITNTFEDDEIRASHRTEYIPVDSTEACSDVERFLRSSFKTMQKEFHHSVPSDWPSDTDFLKLTAASSGLFIYAQVVTQFIGDSAHADPISRFEVLLAVIDRFNGIPTDENPFVHLDALYHEILSSIPPTLWPTAKRLLALTIYASHIDFWCDRGSFKTLRGMSTLLRIPQHVVYASLNKCRSTLKLPDSKVAHKQNLTFHHASFADYLKDSSRSREYYVGNLKDVEDDVKLILEIWNECSGDNIAPASVQITWDQYCSKLDAKTPSKDTAKIHGQIFRDMVKYVLYEVYKIFDDSAESFETLTEPFMYEQLCGLNMINLLYCVDASDLAYFIHSLSEHLSRFSNTPFHRAIELRHLKLGHLDWDEITPTRAYYGRTGKIPMKHWILHRPHSSTELQAFVSELESLQESSANHDVFILGNAPKGRVAVFNFPGYGHLLGNTFYVIPYPE